MLKLISIVYFLLFILSFNLVKGQSSYYKNYTVDNGLPSSEAFHVIQDKKGFIWIATNQGVSRFDGYEFINYDTQSGLPRNTILELFEDEKGRIWFVSLSGELSWFENDSIHQYPYNDVILKFKKGKIGRPLKKSFYVDSNDNVFLGFNLVPLIRIDKAGKLKQIKWKSESIKQVVKIFPDQKVVFSSYREEVEGIEIQFENSFNTVINKKINYKSRFMAEYFDSTLLYVSLNILHLVKNKIEKEIVFNENIVWINRDDNGLIWIGLLWGGVVAFQDLSFNKIVYKLLPKTTITSVLIDTEGGFWFSSSEKGLFYYPNLNIKSYQELEKLKLGKINQVESYGNGVLFAGSGTKVYEIKNDLIRSKNNLGINGNINQYTIIKSIGDTVVYSFYSDLKRFFVLRNENKELWFKDNIFRDCIFVGRDTVYSIYIHLFLHSISGGFSEEVYETDKIRDFYCLLKINSGILLGTDNGLFEFSLESKKYKSINYSPLLRTRMNHLVKDKKQDVVWIGTKGEGLLRLEGEKVSQVSMKEGLLGNSVNHVEQSDSILWLATNNGIVKLFLNDESNFIYTKDSSSVLMETFTRANGLMNNEIYDIALNDGYVYAGTNNGLSCFKQDLSGKNNIAPPIYVTGIKVMGKDTSIQDSYELNYDQNYLEFNFVGLSYQRENSLKYEYILEGVNSDWVETENRSVQFPMLPPGDYVFKVKAYNRSGVESEQVQQVSFKINRAFYQTLFFKMGIAFITLILLSLIFVYIFYVKMREVKKRDLVKDELNKFRQRALSAQMNPHFIYNSLNSVQSYILKNDREKSSTYLAKFGKLMRRILENSQNSVISLHEEIEALKIYIEMELARFRDSFKFYLTIDKDAEIKEINVPPLIIQPYVENAIHHGLRMKKGEKNLWINIFRQEDNICIVIEDDGIGRKESQRIRELSNNRLKSFGTEITDKRLNLFKELYKNDVKIKIVDIEDLDNESKKGTRVEIYIKSLD